jgi:chaperone BCS1
MLSRRLEFGYATREQVRSLFLSFYQHLPPPSVASSRLPGSITSNEPSAQSTHTPAVTATAQDTGLQSNGSDTATSSSVPCQPVSSEELCALAAAFCERAPAGRVTMAALQGHLMRHKRSPAGAVAALDGWIASLPAATEAGAAAD